MHHEVIDMTEPVCLNAAVNNRRDIDKRKIDEVVQTRRQENFLRECICPDADNAAGLEEKLKLLDGVLHRRPDKAKEERHRAKPMAKTNAGSLKMPSQSGMFVS